MVAKLFLTTDLLSVGMQYVSPRFRLLQLMLEVAVTNVDKMMVILH